MPLPRLMLVTDRKRTRCGDLVGAVAAAVRGGVGIVQIRERDLPEDELRALVQSVREAVPEGTRLVVNGNVLVARTMRVGLHLPAAAPGFDPACLHGELYGRSVHDDREAISGARERVSYVLLGTIFPTESKPGRPAAGVGLVERIHRQVHPLPIYAIGGITPSRIPALIHAGAYGVAVSGAILGDNDPQRVSEAMDLALRVAGCPEV